MKEGLQIAETRLTIPGLPRVYTFLHIADTHLSLADECSSPEEQLLAERQTCYWQEQKRRFAAGFGELCEGVYDRPAVEQFEQLLCLAEEMQVDALLAAGDVLDYTGGANLRYLKTAFAHCGVPVLWTRGNHEQSHSTTEEQAYATLMDGDTAFHVRDFDGLLIAAVDNSRKTIQPEQLARFSTLLEQGRPILLLAHIPLRTAEFEPIVMKRHGNAFLMGTEEDSQEAKAFCRMALSADGPVVAVLAGHIHFALEAPFAKGKIQATASSGLIGACRRVVLCPA